MAAVARRTDVVTPMPESTTVMGGSIPALVRRMSWGAILAGVAISLVTMIALNMLGLSIGAATINPVSEADPVGPGFAAGTVIWFAASNLLSLFAGGFVAGYMSGLTDDTDGVLHGLTTWAVVTLITVMVISTSVGSILSGAMSVASSALSATGQTAAAVAPEVADALDVQNMTFTGITNDVRSMVAANQANQTGTANNAANTGTAGTTGTDNTNAATNNNTNMAATGNNGTTTLGLNEIMLNQSLGKLLNSDNPTEEDRTNVVNMLVQNTGMTEDKARETLASWEQSYAQVRADAEETARRVAQAAADAVTAFAGAVFAVMVVSAFAAGVGGMAGTPDTRPVVVATNVATH